MAQNKEINILRQEEHQLIRQLDNDQENISLQTQLKEVRLQIIDVNNKYINELRLEKDKKNILIENEVNKMVEKKVENKKVVVAEKPKQRGAKPKDDAMSSVIAKALMLKGLKNEAAVAKKVVELKPTVDEKKAIKYIKIIIKLTKQGKGRWRNYTWSDEDYLLALKE